MSLCFYCGKKATGYAFIGDNRYCHGDDDLTPTCYEQGQWEDTGIVIPFESLDDNLLNEILGLFLDKEGTTISPQAD